jgi:hypothetical protein
MRWNPFVPIYQPNLCPFVVVLYCIGTWPVSKYVQFDGYITVRTSLMRYRDLTSRPKNKVLILLGLSSKIYCIWRKAYLECRLCTTYFSGPLFRSCRTKVQGTLPVQLFVNPYLFSRSAYIRHKIQYVMK